MHLRILPRLSVLIVVFLSSISPICASDIHRAVVDGDLRLVLSLIDTKAESLNAPDENGRTPLNLAIKQGLDEIADSLIGLRADINLTDNENRSPLHHAAADGNLGIVRLLLEHGTTTINDTSLSQRGGFVGGWTPLHEACLNGHPEVVKLLLDGGANIEARDGVQRTPLILTAESKSLKMAEILIDRGADINAVAIRGYTALLWGARNQFREYVDLLISHKVHIEEDALRRAFHMAVETGMTGLYDYVVELGCDVAETIQRDPWLIFPASASGSVQIVESLIEYGIDPEQADKDGYRAIHGAALGGHTGVVKYLIELGVDKNARNLKGETAYNLATKLEDKKAADYLKMKGSDTSEPQFPVTEGPYMGQQPPGDIPEMFMPGIVSGFSRAHSSIVFSPDGKEAYWTEMDQAEGAVKVSRMVNNRWSYPVVAELDRDPSISPDGNRLFFIKTRPFKPGEEPGGDPDVKEEYWFLERVDSGWSAPISVGDAVNALGVHWPCSIDKDGNLYFSEFKENMYFSEYVDGRYQEPIRITEHFGNATLVGHSPFISPEMDYLLFSTDNGLCISFRKNDGTWTNGINLGNEINGSRVNVSSQITHDGKYMFFVSAGRGRPWGIYWVSIGFIDRLRAEQLLDQ